MNKGCK